MDPKELIQLIHDAGYDVVCHDGNVAVKTRNPAAAAIAIAEIAYENGMLDEALPALRVVEDAYVGDTVLLEFTSVEWPDDEV